MQTTVTALSEVQVKIDVEIPATEVGAAIERQVREFRKAARIPGFRQGKAPREVVVRNFSAQITSSATRQLIDDTFRPALESLGRHLLGEPSVEPGLAREGHPLRYAIRVEVKPEIQVTEWEGIEVSVPPVAVAEEDLNRELQRLRERHQERVPVEDRGAETGDVLVVDTQGRLGGKKDARLDTHGMEVRMGAGMILPGFEDGLQGARAGDTREIDLSYPDDFKTEDMRGQPAAFRVSVKQHFREELPNLDDDFAQDVGFDTLGELREDCRLRLLRAAGARRTSELDHRLIAVLLERLKFAVPSVLVRRQVEASGRRLAQLLMMQGVPEAEAMQILRGSVERLQAEAVFQVRRALVLDALATDQKVSIDDDALNAELVRRIQAGGEQVSKRYEDADERERLRLELRERAVLDLVTKRAKITDAEPTPAPATTEEAPASDEAP